MKPTMIAIAAALSLCAGAARADEVQSCAGSAPPYTDTCAFPITVWYKAATGGTVKSVNLMPGQSAPQFVTPDEKAGVATAVCKQGEKAFDWNGGVHVNAAWTGTGGYECRKG